MYLNYKKIQNKTKLDVAYDNSNIICIPTSKFCDYAKDLHPQPIFASSSNDCKQSCILYSLPNSDRWIRADTRVSCKIKCIV